MKKKTLREMLEPYLYILPIVLLSGILIYYCIGFTVAASFTDWDGLGTEMDFIGLANYKKLFTDNAFLISIKNNLLFFVGTVFTQAVLGLFIAVLLKTKIRGANIYKAIFFLPISMAPAIIAAIFRIILDPNVGSLNNTLRSMGLDVLAKSWLGDPKWALISIIVVNIFQWMGFSMIIYYAGLMSIPDDIYEAARIDGAGFFSQLFKITIPMLKGTTSTLIILGIVGSLKTFDIVMLLTRGGPGRSTEFMATMLYKSAMEEFNGGYSASIGVMLLILAVVMSAVQLRTGKEK